MKYFYLTITLLLILSCNKPDRIEINGTARTIKSGVFGINDVLNKPIYGDNITDGKFKINELLGYAGFYSIKVTDMLNTKKVHIPYEVYLENGTYTIELHSDLSKYPKITSTSTTQNELSAYYNMADELLFEVKNKERQLTEYLKTNEAKNLPQDTYNTQVRNLKDLREKEKEVESTLLERYIEKYPKSTITPHIMLGLDYRNDPLKFNQLFDKLSNEAKNTEEGKNLGEKLSRLVKLVAGQPAPAIHGTSPDGKVFNAKELNKKIYLIDFWRSGNQVSRTNHELIKEKIFFQVNDDKRFGVISINLDEKQDWWLTAIKEDKINWMQYSDLKGNDSKNVEDWGITRVPTYFLVDGNWRIVKRDVFLDDVSFEVDKYLGK